MGGYIIVFVAGVAVGVVLVQANRRCVERAVRDVREDAQQRIDRIAREKSQMQQRYESQLRDRDSRISYQRGMEVGKREGGRSAATTRGEDTAQPYRSPVAATRPEGVAGPTRLNASNSERLEHALQGESGKRTVQIGSRRDAGGRSEAPTRGEDIYPQPRSRGSVADRDGADTEGGAAR